MVTRWRGSRGAAGQADWPRQLTTLEGWRQFTVDVPDVPELLPGPARGGPGRGQNEPAMTSAGWTTTPVLGVATSTLRHVVRRPAADPAEPARDQRPPRPDRLRRGRHRQDHRDHPVRQDPRGDRPAAPPGWHGRIPVVYVTVPPPRLRGSWPWSSPGSSASRSGRANITDVIDAVCGVMLSATRPGAASMKSTTSSSPPAGGEVSDTLKYFSERIPATFVYAGINVERRGCSPAPAASRSPAGSP